MTADQKYNLQESNAAFIRLSNKKYEAGTVEHQTNLWEVPGLLDEAMKEVIDQWHYLFNLKKQIESMVKKLNSYQSGDPN